MNVLESLMSNTEPIAGHAPEQEEARQAQGRRLRRILSSPSGPLGPSGGIPFLINISTYGISNDPDTAIDFEMIADAFDRHTGDLQREQGSASGSQEDNVVDLLDGVSGEGDLPNTSNEANGTDYVPLESTETDSTSFRMNRTLTSQDPFEKALHGRLLMLGSTTRRTRELLRMQACLRELAESPPATTSIRTWAESVRKALSDVGEAVSSEGLGQSDECPSDAASPRSSSSIESIDVRSLASHGTGSSLTDMEGLTAALDNVDKYLASMTDKVKGWPSRVVSQEIDEAYNWLRQHSTLLGLQCTSKSRCPVCLVNQVSAFNDPCGHTLCTSCMRAGKGTCCICREPIKARRRLFGCS